MAAKKKAVKRTVKKPAGKRKNSKLNKGGRPQKMTQSVLRKLKYAFSLGCTDIEACTHAGIGESTLYDYQAANAGFSEEKKRLKQKPFFTARETIIRGLKKTETAKWFMERKKKDEFSLRSEITGKDGKPLDDISDTQAAKIAQAVLNAQKIRAAQSSN